MEAVYSIASELPIMTGKTLDKDRYNSSIKKYIEEKFNGERYKIEKMVVYEYNSKARKCAASARSSHAWSSTAAASSQASSHNPSTKKTCSSQLALIFRRPLASGSPPWMTGRFFSSTRITVNGREFPLILFSIRL